MEGKYRDLFNYRIAYSAARKRTVGFKIDGDTLVVISPKRVSQKFLMELIEKKKYWAIEHIQKKKNKRRFISNGKVLFLGRELDIRTTETTLLKNGGYCELCGNSLLVNLPSNSSGEICEKIIQNWYADQCLKLVCERVSMFAKMHNFKYGKISVKDQKTVWGTCNYRNNLTFNWKIMCFEPSVVDYLVVHELVHTVHRNHSAEYWRDVEKIIPNYKSLNRKLRNI